MLQGHIGLRPHFTDFFSQIFKCYAGMIMYKRPANERRRYIVTLSLIGWAHIQNDPCYGILTVLSVSHFLTIQLQQSLHIYNIYLSLFMIQIVGFQDLYFVVIQITTKWLLHVKMSYQLYWCAQNLAIQWNLTPKHIHHPLWIAAKHIPEPLIHSGWGKIDAIWQTF